MRKLWVSTRGQATIITALLIVAIVTMLGFVLDTGRAYIDHTRLQKSVDSAALAAVQEFPSKSKTSAEIEASKAFEANLNRTVTNNDANEITMRQTSVQYNAMKGNAYDQENYDRMLVTARSEIKNVFGGILGFNKFPLVAQAGAKTGPIGALSEWYPLGITIDQIEFYQHYRISNDNHKDVNNPVEFVPIEKGMLKENVANGIKSRLKVGDIVKRDTEDIKNVCDGINQRFQIKIGTQGCFDVSETKPDTPGANHIGKGEVKQWSYGEDPRLVYLPVVQKKSGSNDEYQVVGFTLFYIEYAHYDPNAYGADVHITELVGYFVKTIIEGPINGNSPNFGVQGIEYINFL